MKRKAQISQVFSYLMTIILVGLIVFVGYKGIAWIMKTNCENGKAAFQKGLLEMIDEYSDRGSAHMQIFSVPCDVTKVCFADTSFCDDPEVYMSEDDIDDALRLEDDDEGNKVIRSSWKDCDANIFTKGKITEPVGYAPKLALKEDDGPFKCFEARSGKIRFLFRGLGRKTQVEAG